MQSAVYRSFPLSRVRSATAGLSLNLIGSVTGALERSLPDARIVTSIPWPLKGVPRDMQGHHLLQALNASGRADWTIVSDVDCGLLLLGDCDLMLATRQITRSTLLFPFQIEVDEVVTSGFEGMSAPEAHEGDHWRWVHSTDGAARFTICVPSGLDELTWSFTPMFPNLGLAARTSDVTLMVSDAGERREHAIAPHQRATIPLHLRSGSNLVAFSTDLPCITTEADWRTLSIAVLQPELIHDGRVVLGPERFLAGEGISALGRVRRTLHGFGFEVVTGTMCSTGHLDNYRTVPLSVGSPLQAILGNASLPLAKEITAGPDEVVWWSCGDGWNG